MRLTRRPCACGRRGSCRWARAIALYQPAARAAARGARAARLGRSKAGGGSFRRRDQMQAEGAETSPRLPRSGAPLGGPARGLLQSWRLLAVATNRSRAARLPSLPCARPQHEQGKARAGAKRGLPLPPFNSYTTPGIPGRIKHARRTCGDPCRPGCHPRSSRLCARSFVHAKM